MLNTISKDLDKMGKKNDLRCRNEHVSFGTFTCPQKLDNWIKMEYSLQLLENTCLHTGALFSLFGRTMYCM